eukprot:TRINITY_DN2328_c0_g1_i1.p1 TRINITY_DN2328_c0_g1~~TRINITY_DN2328_c0_g1_i1.p1  ORF type:complete len:163 (-),score=39.94 TRINITY_DN2328_c0_g1_i1:201-689(-)
MGNIFKKKKKKQPGVRVVGEGETSNPSEDLLKVLTIGDPGVGKSSLILKFTENTFSETYIATIGSDFKTKVIQAKEKKVKLQVWDTAGQERFRTITSSYYRGAQIIFVCYDTTKKDTYNNIKKWIDEVRSFAADIVTVVIIGCKADLKSDREVAEDEAKVSQ